MGYMGSLTTGCSLSTFGESGLNVQLATVNLFLALTLIDFTEKVTKTFHSFLGSSSPVVAESGKWGLMLVPWIEW